MPLLLVIATLIKLDSSGPVLFRQLRMGKATRLFEIYKFRTMIVGAAEKGPKITVRRDQRLSRVGRILRRFDLDELPSLLNVLRGDMSIVGPRPELPQYLPYYTEEQKRVFSVKPGLTELGTLFFRNEAAQLVGDDPEAIYIGEVLPRKITLQLEYIRRQSFLYDLVIICKTLPIVLLGEKS